MSQLVEQRTIDIIPHDERHGRVRDLFTIWFGSNILPLTVYTARSRCRRSAWASGRA